jgi:VIT1/CCC1 family predicted Fe2+/Mn2+ transporter
MISRARREKFVWNFTFGVEDSLVSTVGLVSGVAVGGMARQSIILTGAVLIFVEALSMGVGSFLTDQSVEEFEKHREVAAKNSLPGAVVMFVSYFLAGLIPLVPYLIVAVKTAFPVSMVMTLMSLFVLGLANGIYSKVHPIKEGLRMMFFGGLAIIGGVTVGKIFGVNGFIF